MSFTKEERKKVFDFFENVLMTVSTPIYYEYLRGHVNKACSCVKRYILQKCKGRDLLEFFTRRKNYFTVEDGYVSLREDDPTMSHSNEVNQCSPNKNKKAKKFRRDSDRESQESKTSERKIDDCKIDEERVQFEAIALKYFVSLLRRQENVELDSIVVDDLPKKVKRCIVNYYKGKVISFLNSYDLSFSIDNERRVTLNESEEEVSVSMEDISDIIRTEENPASQNDMEKMEVQFHIKSILFFSDILKQKPQPLDQLGGYFSQASKDIRDYIKRTHKNFRSFFIKIPLFELGDDEVRLHRESKVPLRMAKKFLMDETDESFCNEYCAKSGMPLKSFVDILLEPATYKASAHVDKQPRKNTQELSENEYTDGLNEDLWTLEDTEETQSSQNEHSWMSPRSSMDSLSEPATYHSMDSLSEPAACQASAHIHKQQDMNKQDISENVYAEAYTKRVQSNSCYDTEGLNEDICRFMLSTLLYSLEIIETESFNNLDLDIKAVMHFARIIESKHDVCSFDCLHGTLGQTSREISGYINIMYKGEKFPFFFWDHEEFHVHHHTSFVSLRNPYEETVQRCLEMSENKMGQLGDILHLFREKQYVPVQCELYDFIHFICDFLQNKDASKISRISGMLSKFPNCNKWIRKLEESTDNDKITHFLQIFEIFQFPSEGYVSFKYTPELCTFLTSTRHKTDALHNFMSSYKESLYLIPAQMKIVSDVVESELKNRSLRYHMLPKLIKSYLARSRAMFIPLLHALVNNFSLKNGIVSLLHDSDTSLNEKYDKLKENIVSSVSRETEIAGTIMNCPEGLTMNSGECNPVNFNEVTTKNNEDATKNCNEATTINCNEATTISSNDSIQQTETFKTVVARSLIEEILELENDENSELCNDSDGTTDMIDSDIFVEDDIAISNPISSDNHLDKIENDASITHKDQDLKNEEDEIEMTEDETILEENCNQQHKIETIKSLYKSTETTQNPVARETELKPDEILESVLNMKEYPAFSKKPNQLLVENLNQDSATTNNPSKMFFKNEVNSENPVDQLSHQDYENNSKEINKDKNASTLLHTNEHFEFKYKDNPMNCAALGSDQINQGSGDSLTENNLDKRAQNNHGNIEPLKCLKTENNTLQLETKLDGCESGSLKSEQMVFKTRSDSFNQSENFVQAEECKEASTHTIDHYINNSKYIETNDKFSRNHPSKTSDILPTEKEKDELKLCKSNYNTKMESSNSIQPIRAHVIVLTGDSCFAESIIDGNKQVIYILKPVFRCNDENCNSECFNNLSVGDIVFCFVPQTKARRGSWIALAASKDANDKFNDFEYVNHLTMQVGGITFQQSSAEHKVDVSTCPHCRTEQTMVESTPTSANITSHARMANASSQTTVDGAKESKMKSSKCQTDIVILMESCECQTEVSGNIKPALECEEISCQTEIVGEVKTKQKEKDAHSQTVSTGPVIITDFYHLD